MNNYWRAILCGISHGIPPYSPIIEVLKDRIILKCKVMVDHMNKSRFDEKLKKELKSLQNKFNAGHELTLKYLPGEIRYSENNKPLAGEIVSGIIIIYEAKEDKAIDALHHEFIEYLITPLLKDSFYIISYQNKIITKLLLNKKEDIVEQLSNSLRKRAFND